MTDPLPVIDDELRSAATTTRAAEQELEHVILRAHRAGMSHRRIAELIDRSHPTVGRIVDRLTRQEPT